MKTNIKKMLRLLVEMEQDTTFYKDYHPWMTDNQVYELISRLQDEKIEMKQKEEKIKSLFLRLPA